MAGDQQTPDTLEEFMTLLETGTLSSVREALTDMHAADIALILESLPTDDRLTIWDLSPKDKKGDTLAHVNEAVRAQLIQKMNTADLITATETLPTDDLADIFEDLPHQVSQEMLQAMDEENRAHLQQALAYPEDSAGGLMNFDYITIRADIEVEVVIRFLRFRGQIPPSTNKLFVIDRSGLFLGEVLLNTLLLKEPGTLVSEIMNREPDPVRVTTPAKEVASLFERRDLISTAVLNDDGIIVGRITIDDVVDVIREEAEHAMMSSVGLSEEDDMFAPVVASSRRRALWLGINLLTALLASWVIGLFDKTIEHIVALAVLMPIVASMGGIAGSQTLTLVVRGLALRAISEGNARNIMRKELAVGVLNGLIWAVVVGLIADYWFADSNLGIIIGLAIIANLICAALAGTFIPLALKRMNIDPALAGGVVLTTVTDVVGFFAFLGLATLFLM